MTERQEMLQKVNDCRNHPGGHEIFPQKVKLKRVEDSTSCRGNGLGRQIKAGVDKPCLEDNE